MEVSKVETARRTAGAQLLRAVVTSMHAHLPIGERLRVYTLIRCRRIGLPWSRFCEDYE